MTSGWAEPGQAIGAGADDHAWSSLLRQIIELSTEDRSLRSVVRRVAEFVVAASGADVCFVHVVDHEAGELVLMGATPEQFDELAGTIRLRMGEGVAGWVAKHAEPAVVGDKWSDSRYVYIPALKGEEFNSLISVPLLRPHGMVIGVLNVHSRQSQHFAANDVERLGEVACLLAGIVENAVLFDRLANREAELERFAARTIELQEHDRRRIAADIHDGISQRLVSAWYHLRAARGLATTAALLEEISTTEALLSDALDEARHAIVGLRPAVLDDLGLTAGITSLASSLGADTDIELDLDPCSLPTHVETALFRISQEALQNVMKHAHASTVTIKLRLTGHGVSLSIADDGIGFDPARAGGAMSYGIEGMQERAALLGAHLEVQARPGHGTSIIVHVPLRHVGPAGTGTGAGGVKVAAPGVPRP
ncbi:MAG: GAF domain-containing protein [Actinomycetota bacterium]|nr:GAF domain-containing protein [Actinomycetota bacterium]